MNKTLQDRLVKALREENISDIDTANKYLKEVFLPDFNKKFMYKPQNDSDLHLKLRNDEKININQYFSEHIKRKVANDFTIQFNHEYYQLFKTKESKYTIKP